MERQEVEAHAKARRLSLAQLIDAWDETDRHVINADLWTVRGWLMDELERRDPAAFLLWIDSAEYSPRTFYAAA